VCVVWGLQVPLSWMHFVMSSYGGLVGWEGEGSPFPETDRAITHQIVDRPALVRGRRTT
jgi:pescadillo protein